MIARLLTTVKVRARPSISAGEVATYNSGETLNYDQTINNEGRLWISYIGKSGIRRYCCAIETNGKKYINLGNNKVNSKIILASYFDNKMGCKNNNLYDGGFYYVNYLLILIKKIIEL